MPVEAVGDAGAILDPVVTGKAIEREEVRIFEVDRARILVRDGEIADRRAGGELDSGRQHLLAAQKFADERPFHIHRGDRDPARFPARIAAIERGFGECVVARMIDVAAHEAGQRDQLAHAGNAPHIPFGAGEGALGVLPVAAQDGEAVGLQFDLAAQQRIGEAMAIVDRGQGQRHLALIGAEAQGLRRPAGDREIGILVDPLDIDRGAQPVVPADVVTAQEGPVARAPRRSGHAPIGIELELAVGKDVAAKIAFAHAIARQVRNAAAVCAVTRDLECALVRELAILTAHHRQCFGEEIGAERRVAIGAEPPVIAAADFQPVAFRDAQVGHQEACDGTPVGADGEAGQRQDARAEQFEIGVAEADPAVVRVVGHPIGGDAPARRLVAAFGRGDGAGGIGRALQLDRAVRCARSGLRREPSPLAQRQQEVLHRARFEFVGQRHAVGKQLVAVLVHEADAPIGEDFAAIAVPGHAIRPHRAIAAAQDNIAAGGDGVAGRIVAQRIGFEGDLVLTRDQAGRKVDRVLRRGFRRALAQIGAVFLFVEPVRVGPVGLFLRSRHACGRAILRGGGRGVETGDQTDA